MNIYLWPIEYRQKLSLSWKRCHFENSHQIFFYCVNTYAKC